MLAITSQLDSDVDFLAWELRPVALDDLGLSAALRTYTSHWGQQFNTKAEFHTRGFEDERPAKEIETNLYRIAQEALNNVAKHADASQVDVILERRDDTAVLIVEDNGVGFDAAILENATMGIMGMRERASLIGGQFEIESSPGEGTSIFVRVPLTDGAGAG